MFNWIYYAIFQMFWTFNFFAFNILKGILWLFHQVAVEFPFRVILGISSTQPLSDISLPRLFIVFSLIVVVSFIGFVLVGYFRSINHDTESGKKPAIISTLKYAFLSTIWLITIPIAFYLISSFAIQLINAFLFSNGQPALTDTLLKAMYMKEWEANGLTLERWITEVNQNNFWITKNVFNAMNSGDGVKTNISGYILIIGAAYAVIMSFIRLVEFIFHLVILFFVAPFSAAGSLLDDGLSIKKWNRKFWSKNIVVYSMLLSLIIFGFVVEMAVDFLNTLNLYWVVKIVFLALITIGSCFACLSFTSIVANLIGEEISVRKNVANLKAKAASFKVLKSPKATKTTKAKPGTKPALQRNQKTLMKRNQAFKPQQLMQRGQVNKTQSMRERLKQALVKANATQQATKPNI